MCNILFLLNIIVFHLYNGSDLLKKQIAMEVFVVKISDIYSVTSSFLDSLNEGYQWGVDFMEPALSSPYTQAYTQVFFDNLPYMFAVWESVCFLHEVVDLTRAKPASSKLYDVAFLVTRAAMIYGLVTGAPLWMSAAAAGKIVLLLGSACGSPQGRTLFAALQAVALMGTLAYFAPEIEASMPEWTMDLSSQVTPYMQHVVLQVTPYVEHAFISLQSTLQAYNLL